MSGLPTRLAAPEPGWTVDTDVVVVGSGIAGLTTALHLSRQSSLRVLLVTKDVLAAGSTRWAQGGIAAALGAGDSPDEHFRDTIVAGAGVCDEAAVRVLVREGAAAVRELAQMGARFDRTADGKLSLTREGGHHRDRIAHAGGDATGAEIERALVTRVLDATGTRVIEHALLLDLITDDDGGVTGLTLHVMGEGECDGVGAVRARAVVLATGGIGQVYASTTNPSVSTGDGVAAALRAGAVVRDLEFVQFHPTVAYLGPHSRGQQPLVSEAVRGEGAVLVDDDGVPFMQGVHELADLAPRDVVAKAILRRMRDTGAEHVWLDARSFGLEKWRVRFPTILSTLLSLGIDPVRERIPVVPACHYASGGVRVDLTGESSLRNLFVCGESACTGVHGANRLASNSLLEGLVFGHRIAATLMDRLDLPSAPTPRDAPPATGSLVSDAARTAVQQSMSQQVGVLRDEKGLHAAREGLGDVVDAAGGTPGTDAWETTNLVTVASALVQAAALRRETRGTHWRDDYPYTDDEWRGHLDTRLNRDGTLTTSYLPLEHPSLEQK